MAHDRLLMIKYNHCITFGYNIISGLNFGNWVMLAGRLEVMIMDHSS
jgi:hypothetical protein